MKYVILAMAMMVAATVNAEENPDTQKSECANVGEFASWVMANRQFYKPMRELMEQTDNEHARFIIMNAYELPIYEEAHEKLEEINDFASHYSGQCYREEMEASDETPIKSK